MFLSLLLGQYPGFVFVDILIGHIGQGHDLAHGLTEFAFLVQLGDAVPGVDKGFVQVGIAAMVGEFAVEFLADKSGTATGDVDHLTHQVGVDAQHEVFQVEVDVIDAAGELGGKIVAQVFGIEMIKILARVKKRAA